MMLAEQATTKSSRVDGEGTAVSLPLQAWCQRPRRRRMWVRASGWGRWAEAIEVAEVGMMDDGVV